MLCAELDPSAEYMVWVLRGSCWNDENACGDAGPVGKKLATGDVGGEVYREDMMVLQRFGMVGNGRGGSWQRRRIYASRVRVIVNSVMRRQGCSRARRRPTEGGRGVISVWLVECGQGGCWASEAWGTRSIAALFYATRRG